MNVDTIEVLTVDTHGVRVAVGAGPREVFVQWEAPFGSGVKVYSRRANFSHDRAYRLCCSLAEQVQRQREGAKQ